MNATPESALLTAEAYLRHPDSEYSELVDGRIVRLSPAGARHAALESALAAIMRDHIAPRGLGWVLVGEVGLIVRRDDDVVLGADIAVVRRTEALGRLPDGFLETPPEVVVEILSPGHRRRVMDFKVVAYLEFGVREVWVIDPQTNTIDVIAVGKRTTYRPGDVMRPSGLLTGAEIDVTALLE
jgi:Uma2 family endonuclease